MGRESLAGSAARGCLEKGGNGAVLHLQHLGKCHDEEPKPSPEHPLQTFPGQGRAHRKAQQEGNSGKG